MHNSVFLSWLSLAIVFSKIVTASPDPLITPKPRAPTEAQLKRRQDDTGPNVYGYINGDVNSPLGCGAGYQWSSSGDLGACCNQVSCTNVVFTCVDKRGGIDICSDAMSAVYCRDATVLRCKSPEPSCFRYMRITDAQDTNPNYIHRCGTASDDITVLVTPTNEVAVQTLDSPSATRDSSVLRSTSMVFKSQGSSADPTSGPSSTPNGGPGSTSGTNSDIWKYAAIGVGGVVVILAVILAVLCVRRRSRKHNQAKHQGIGYQPANLPPMQTEDGSVAGYPMSADKRAATTRWAQSQGSRRPLPSSISELDTLVDSDTGSRN